LNEGLAAAKEKLFMRISLVLTVICVALAVRGMGDAKKLHNGLTSGQSTQTEPAPLKGCQEKEIRSGKEKGVQHRFYAAPPPKVKEALLSALASLEFNVKKDNGDEISAQKSRHVGVFVGSGGETLVLRLAPAEEAGKQGTRVDGETKKGVVGRAGQKSWTNAVLDQTSCMLEKSS
jgi:hypothetical protein